MIVNYSEIPGKKLYFSRNTSPQEDKFDGIYTITEVQFHTGAKSANREDSWAVLSNEQGEQIKMMFNVAALPIEGKDFKIGKLVGVLFDDQGKLEYYKILTD